MIPCVLCGWRRGCFCVVCFLLVVFGDAKDLYAIDLTSQMRRPVAGVLIDQSTIAVANRSSGTISLVNLETQTVVSETKMGESLVDLQRLSGNRVVAVDHSRHQVVVCRVDPEGIHEDARYPVKPFPISVSVSRNGSWFVVASLWSQHLSILSAETGIEGETIRLPFAPRCVLVAEEQNRVVAVDAFGGKIAVIRVGSRADSGVPAKLSIESVREIPGHNVSKLSMSGVGMERRLHLSQMSLSAVAQPSKDDIHWGTYVSSGIRSLSLDSVFDPESSISRDGHHVTIGDVGHGSADPRDFVIDDDGRFVVAVSGTDELAVFDSHGRDLGRIEVGNGPTTVLAIGNSRFACLNEFDDSVMVVFVPRNQANGLVVESTISLGPSPKLSAVAIGERLFRSAKLSHDGWISCHSCHTDGHTCGLLVDTLGDNVMGAPKRVLSLRGIAGTQPFGWNGSMGFRTQVSKSVQQTMHGAALSDEQSDALIAYLRSLPPLPSQSETNSDAMNGDAIDQGEKLFATIGCVKCHQGDLKTSAEIYDVNIADSKGNRRFNPPSLRGVRYRDRLLHDKRAHGLKDLVLNHHFPNPVELTIDQIDALVAYLNSL